MNLKNRVKGEGGDETLLVVASLVFLFFYAYSPGLRNTISNIFTFPNSRGVSHELSISDYSEAGYKPDSSSLVQSEVNSDLVYTGDYYCEGATYDYDGNGITEEINTVFATVKDLRNGQLRVHKILNHNICYNPYTDPNRPRCNVQLSYNKKTGEQYSISQCPPLP